MADDLELRALIEKVTLDVLQKQNRDQKPEHGALRGKILVLYDGEPPEGNPPPPGDRVIWQAGMKVRVEDLEGVEVAALSVTSLAKLVHLIWDTPLLEQAGLALLSGIPVSVSDPRWKNGAILKSRGGPFSTAFAAVVERARHLGLRFEGDGGVSEAVAREKVLTREDILNYQRSGIRKIEIPPGCIVTPLAAETARDRGITLHHRSSG